MKDEGFSDLFSQKSYLTSFVPAKQRGRGLKRMSAMSKVTSSTTSIAYLEDVDLRSKVNTLDDVIDQTSIYMMR